MMDPQTVAAIAEVLDRSDRVLVVTHIQPDGDAISSLLATGFALEQLNISFDLVCDDKLPLRFNFLPRINLILTTPPRNVNHDLLIALDAGDEMRLGQAYADLDHPKPPIINIDHHVTNTNYGIVNIVDSQASSTTEILHRLLPLLGVDISADIAQCLLTGLITDTLNFSTSSVSSTTLKAAASLIDAGANLFEISSKGYKLQQLSTLMLWQVGLKNMKIEEGLLWTTISNVEREVAGHTGSSSFGLGNFMADVYQAAMSAVLVELDDGDISVGFRCRPPYDVAEIATSLGGGGHRLAAGCTVDGSLDEVERLVISQSKVSIRKQRSQLH
jgi:bifunctional oligoribonuclease and PAP phosphatase NrnA